MGNVFEIAWLSLFVATCAVGGTIAIPDSPSPEFADLKSVTNVPLSRAMLQRARVFEATVSLLATASNSVEVAFGRSRNHDGVLSPGDEAFAFGWNAGAWFCASSNNCIASEPYDTPAMRSLSFVLRVSENGAPLSLSFSGIGDGDSLAALAATPPDWMFSRDWDTARLTVRGADEPDETVVVRFDNDPVVFLAR